MESLKECVLDQIEIPEVILNEISGRFYETDLKKGDLFASPGKKCTKLAFINKGLMRIYNVADGKEITLWISAENNFITSLSSFIFQIPSKWHIEALEDSNLYVISRDDHFEMLKKYPSWMEFDNIALANAFALLEARMFEQLYKPAEDRYLSLFQQNPSLFNRVPLQYLASMLGITPETLSRLRKRMVSEFS